jgi:hypothetical protein
MHRRAPWRYTHHVDSARAEDLLGTTNFTDIAVDLARDFVASVCKVQPATQSNLLKQHGCKRVELRLLPVSSWQVCPSTTADRFFNSPVGYRAQFYISPSVGDRASADLFSLLISGPLRAFVRDGVDEWPGLFVERSLSAPSSKIWIPQEQWPIPEEGVRDIEATDWIAAQEGKVRYSIAGQPIPWTAFLGTRAPNPASFDVMGAWLDDKAQVFIDPDKADRSQRLSAFGWV